MVELTIQIPDDLATQLRPVQDRLIEIIELGLRQIAPAQYPLHQEVIEFLASGPPPQTIIDFHPSIDAQSRVASLLAKNEEGSLTPDEQRELDEYENLDFMMTLVKVQARKRLSPQEPHSITN